MRDRERREKPSVAGGGGGRGARRGLRSVGGAWAAGGGRQTGARGRQGAGRAGRRRLHPRQAVGEVRLQAHMGGLDICGRGWPVSGPVNSPDSVSACASATLCVRMCQSVCCLCLCAYRRIHFPRPHPILPNPSPPASPGPAPTVPVPHIPTQSFLKASPTSPLGLLLSPQVLRSAHRLHPSIGPCPISLGPAHLLRPRPSP